MSRLAVKVWAAAKATSRDRNWILRMAFISHTVDGWVEKMGGESFVCNQDFPIAAAIFALAKPGRVREIDDFPIGATAQGTGHVDLQIVAGILGKLMLGRDERRGRRVFLSHAGQITPVSDEVKRI